MKGCESRMRSGTTDNQDSQAAEGSAYQGYLADGFAAGGFNLKEVDSARNRVASCILAGPRYSPYTGLDERIEQLHDSLSTNIIDRYTNLLRRPYFVPQ